MPFVELNPTIHPAASFTAVIAPCKPVVGVPNLSFRSDPPPDDGNFCLFEVRAPCNREDMADIGFCNMEDIPPLSWDSIGPAPPASIVLAAFNLFMMTSPDFMI